jgi:hypothetical protein
MAIKANLVRIDTEVIRAIDDYRVREYPYKTRGAAVRKALDEYLQRQPSASAGGEGRSEGKGSPGLAVTCLYQLRNATICSRLTYVGVQVVSLESNACAKQLFKSPHKNVSKSQHAVQSARQPNANTCSRAFVHVMSFGIKCRPR